MKLKINEIYFKDNQVLILIITFLSILVLELRKTPEILSTTLIINYSIYFLIYLAIIITSLFLVIHSWKYNYVTKIIAVIFALIPFFIGASLFDDFKLLNYLVGIPLIFLFVIILFGPTEIFTRINKKTYKKITTNIIFLIIGMTLLWKLGEYNVYEIMQGWNFFFQFILMSLILTVSFCLVIFPLINLSIKLIRFILKLLKISYGFIKNKLESLKNG